MMVEVEYHGRKAMAKIGLVGEGENESEVMESVFEGLNTTFTCAFVIELICRLAAFGRQFLNKPSSWLDIVIVLGSVLDVVGAAETVNLTFLRLIRLTKLTRLLKAALMAPFCEPLRVLMKSISHSLFPIFWSFVLLALICIVAALFLTQVLADTITDPDRDLDTRKFIYTYYGTMSRTTLTMFQVTMAPGAWSIVGRRIIEEVNPGFAWFFLVYVAGVSFAIIRIITALFLSQTLEIAAKDNELMRVEKVKSQRRYSENNVMAKFTEAGVEDHGHLSFSEFQKFITEPEGQAWLSVLELDTTDAASIFQLVNDGDGRVTIDEFLMGVFKLKNTSKPLDLLVLHYEAKKMGKMFGNFQEQLDELSNVFEESISTIKGNRRR